MCRFAGALPLLLLSAGCTEPIQLDREGVPPAGVFTTDATIYRAKITDVIFGYPIYSFTVVAKYTNGSAAPIYLANCYPDSPTPTYGVELIGQTDPWGAAYNQAWACVGHDRQIVVAAGETRVDTLRLTGPNAADGNTHKPFGVTSGQFRLWYGVQTCPGDAKCRISSDSLSASNEFTVRLPD